MLSVRVCRIVARVTLIPSVEYLSDQVGTNNRTIYKINIVLQDLCSLELAVLDENRKGLYQRDKVLGDPKYDAIL